MQGQATVAELVRLGVNHAQQYVPKDSYTTYRSIKGKVNQTQDGGNGAVFIELRRHADGRLDTHQLAKYMAEGKSGRGPGGYNHFKTGNPRFMQNTRRYLNRIKLQIGNKNIKKGNSSIGGSV